MPKILITYLIMKYKCQFREFKISIAVTYILLSESVSSYVSLRTFKLFKRIDIYILYNSADYDINKKNLTTVH